MFFPFFFCRAILSILCIFIFVCILVCVGCCVCYICTPNKLNKKFKTSDEHIETLTPNITNHHHHHYSNQTYEQPYPNPRYRINSAPAPLNSPPVNLLDEPTPVDSTEIPIPVRKFTLPERPSSFLSQALSFGGSVIWGTESQQNFLRKQLKKKEKEQMELEELEGAVGGIEEGIYERIKETNF